MLKSIVDKIDTRTILSLIVTFALIATIFVLAAIKFPDSNKDMLNMLTGSLIILVKDAFSYYYNTNQGSDDKNGTIKKLADNQPDNVTNTNKANWIKDDPK